MYALLCKVTLLLTVGPAGSARTVRYIASTWNEKWHGIKMFVERCTFSRLRINQTLWQVFVLNCKNQSCVETVLEWLCTVPQSLHHITRLKFPDGLLFPIYVDWHHHYDRAHGNKVVSFTALTTQDDWSTKLLSTICSLRHHNACCVMVRYLELHAVSWLLVSDATPSQHAFGGLGCLPQSWGQISQSKTLHICHSYSCIHTGKWIYKNMNPCTLWSKLNTCGKSYASSKK